MNEKCVESIPYASTIGFILLVFGCGVFSGTIWEGSDRLNRLFKDQFFEITQPDVLQKVSVIIVVVTIVLGLIILIYGITMTGRTRRKIFKYYEEPGKCNSRTTGGFLLGCCYLMLASWLFICAIGMAGVGVWLAVSSVCSHEMEYWRTVTTDKDAAVFTYSFNLSNYGIYSTRNTGRTQINTAGGMQQFCSEMSTIGPLFSVGFVCSILVLIALLMLISALAANMIRLKYLPEITKFHQIAMGNGGGGSSLGQPPGTVSLVTHSTAGGAVASGGGGGGGGAITGMGDCYAAGVQVSSGTTTATMEMQPLTGPAANIDDNGNGNGGGSGGGGPNYNNYSQYSALLQQQPQYYQQQQQQQQQQQHQYQHPNTSLV